MPEEAASTRWTELSCLQLPVLTASSDWSFKGGLVRQLSTSARLNSASSVDSSAWSITLRKAYIKVVTVFTHNSGHTLQWLFVGPSVQGHHGCLVKAGKLGQVSNLRLEIYRNCRKQLWAITHKGYLICAGPAL